MFLNYDPEKIEKFSNDFLIATGVEIGVCDENFKRLNYRKPSGNKYCAMIHEKEVRRVVCRRCDHDLLAKCKAQGRAVMHVCHAGLVDLGVPIMHENKIIAYLILGQFRTEESFPNLQKKELFSEEELKKLKSLYNERPIFDNEKIESIANVAMMMVRYILFENVLIPKYDPAFERALAFINENFERALTISEISKAAIIPKSSLYKMFHTHFDCTVNEYINTKRIDKAAEILLNGSLSIEEISEKLGFSTQQYFSKIFKKIKGVSPAQFRKNNR